MKKGFKIFMYSLILTCMFFVASCERKIYTITFEENGGSEVTDVQIPVNEVPELPNALTKEGHTFSGWFLDETLKFKYSPAKVEGNMTLYAKWTVNKYTISYETNGGTQISEHSINFGSEIELAANPTKVGHEFVGWYTDAALSNKFEETTMPAENIKLYAAWDAYDYVIKFVSNDDEIEDYRQTVEYGQKVTRPADPTREGYTFKGWQVKEEAYDFDTVVKADVTLIASWEINSYTISFDSNGGSEVADASYNYGALLSEPARPTKLGYTFNCWTLNDQPYSFVGKTMPASNLNLKASWLAGNYTVYFNANASNATGTVASIGAYYDQEFEIPANAYSLTGYTFAGWNAEEDGNGDSYTVGSKVSNLTSEKDGVVVIYAQWTPNTYTVKFDANGGSGTMTNLTMTYDKESGLTANSFTRVGYAFEGWALTADGAVRYGNEDSVSNLAASGEVTLYAKWTSNGYTVAYDANTGTGTMSSDARFVDDNKSIKANTFTKKGYTFAGWNTLADGTGEVIAIDSKANLTTTANKTVILYAQWTANSYTVKYDGNGNTNNVTMADQARKYDDGLTISANQFEKVGYTFVGWLYGEQEVEDLDATNLSDTEGTIVTLVAQWSANSYTVAYDANTGTGTMSSDARFVDDNKSVKSNTFVKTGYTFAGWNTLANGEGQTIANDSKENLATENGATVTLYAQWTANSYTVKYDGNGNTNNVTMADQARKYDDGLTISANQFEKVGYTFVGWLYGEQEVEDLDATNLSDTEGTIVTLVAQWVPINYTISFNLNGGTGTFANITNVTYDTERQLPASIPTKEGFTFAGWKLTDVTYQASAMVKNLANTQGAVVELVAQWTRNEYTLTIVYNNGAGNKEVKYLFEAVIENEANPEKENTVFKGWTTSDGADFTFENSTMPAHDLTIYASYLNEVKIYFNLNYVGAETPEAFRPIDGVQGQQMPTPSSEPTRKGYTFAGWYAEEECVNEFEFTLFGEEDVFAYAKWTPITYTIKFDLNDGEGDFANINNVVYDQSKQLPTNIPTKTGYIFAGWTLGEDNYQAGANVLGLAYTQDAEVTLVASWNAISYTVAYNANGGSNTMSSEARLYDDNKEIKSNTFVKTGYTFVGWNTLANGEGQTINNNSKENLTIENGVTVTLYAQWTANSYTVKYDGNGNTNNVTMAEQARKYDDGLTISPNQFEKVGYTFVGWLYGEQEVEDLDATNLSDTEGTIVTLVAQWSANSYTVAYDANTGTGTMSSDARFVDDNKSVKSNTFVKTGYTFAGWNTLANGEGQVIAIDFNGNLTTTAGATVTLYAQWTANTYTIKFDGNGNTNEVTMADQVRKYNDNEFVSYNLFAKTGYTFAGWLLNDKEVSASSKENLTELVGLENTNNAEITLKARWVANSYTVIFNANEGNGNMTNQSLTYDDAKGLNPNLFTKVGYSFVGWATTTDGQVAYTDEQEVINLVGSGSITLYAVWVADTYTVLFQHGKDDVTNTRTVKYDDLLDLTNTFDNPFEYTGHTFDGWLLNEGDRNATFTTDVEQVKFNKEVIRTINTEAKQLTLTAKWLANDVTVNFYDAADSSTVASVTVKYGDTYSKLEDAVKDNWVKYGYKYIGAYSSAQCLDSESITFTGNQTEIFDSLDLYFKWESTKYTVKFIVDGQAVFTIPEQVYMAEGIGEQFNAYIDGMKYDLDLVSRYHKVFDQISKGNQEYFGVFGKISDFANHKENLTTTDETTYEAGFLVKLVSKYSAVGDLTTVFGQQFAVLAPQLGDDPTNSDLQNALLGILAPIYGYLNTIKVDLEEKASMFATKDQNGYYIPSKEGYMCEGWVLGDATAYGPESQKGSPFTGHVPASTEAFEDGADVRIVAKWNGVDAINLTKDNFKDDGEIKKLTWQAVTIDSAEYKSYSVVYVITHESLDGTRKELVRTSDTEYVFNTTDPSNEEKPYFAPGTYRIRVTAEVMVETQEGEKYNLISEDAKAPLDVTFALNNLVDEDLIANKIVGSYYYKLGIEDPDNPNALDVFYFYTGYNYNFAATNSFQLLDREHGEPIDENDYVAISKNVISTKDVFGTFHFTNTKDGVTTEFLAYVLPVVSQFDFGEDLSQFISLNNKEVESLYQTKDIQDYQIGVSTLSKNHADYIIYKKGDDFITSEEINKMIASGQTINLDEYEAKYDNGFKFDVALKTTNGEAINTADYQKAHLEYKFFAIVDGKDVDITEQFGYKKNDVWFINPELLNREIISSNGSDYVLGDILADTEENKSKLAEIANRKYKVEISIYEFYVPDALKSIVKPITFEFKLNKAINVFSHEALKSTFADTSLHAGINVHSNITPVLSADQYYSETNSWGHSNLEAVKGTPINVRASTVMSNPTKSNGNVYQRIANQNTFTENYKINGNFFTINGENLPYTNVYSLQNLSDVPGYEICDVQMAIFAYFLTDDYNAKPFGTSDDQLSISNLRVIGNSMNASLEMDGISLMNKNSGGYIGVRTTYGSTLNLDNSIVQNTNIAVFVTAGSSAYLNYFASSSNWSNTIYGHGPKTVEVRNSHIKDSGGAAIHLEDTISTSNPNYRANVKPENSVFEYNGKKIDYYSSLYIDNTTTFDNYVSGEEGYFKANSIELLVMKLKSQFDTDIRNATGSNFPVEALQSVMPTYGVINQELFVKEQVEKINFILLMPPADPNKVPTNEVIDTWGSVIGDKTTGAQTNYITLNVGFVPYKCNDCGRYFETDGKCPYCKDENDPNKGIVSFLGSHIPLPTTFGADYSVMSNSLVFNEFVDNQLPSAGYSIVPFPIPGFGNSVICLGIEPVVN